MGTDKRDRQKDNRRERLEAQAHEWRKQQRNKRMFSVLLIVMVVGLAVLAVSFLTKDDEQTDSANSTLPTMPTIPGTDSTGSIPEPVSVPAGASITGETPCPETDGSSERTTSFEQAPPSCLEDGVEYDAVVTTDAGAFTIQLDREAAPQTVNNFVTLARYHYYDGVAFHRVIPGFMIQGGDAVGQPPGTGGPGYSFEDELPASVDEYVEGSVAMANSGPNTNGSQFFVVTTVGSLGTPDYSLFGQVTEGMDVVKAIEADGTPAGTPMVTHTIQSVEIVERAADEAGSATTAPTTAPAGDPAG